ncbi:ATP-binding cassette domain-containing protein [Mycoplasma sp. P36-A1]|uniref:ABC transporter ATP-binding protein/permease n=1 Tax=Mycoplasma sp. P36-A1 TaxID=3252900 RepID=UPI003C2ED148
MLEVKSVSKYYSSGSGKFKALDEINFQVEPGNLVAIVGPSGGGKTTLMNILGALDSDFDGDVIVNGKSLKSAAGKDLESYRKNTVGFVFQNFTLINSLTAYENVELALEISNVDKKTRKVKVMELLNSVGLKEHAKKKVNVLSGGQKQRVAIARSLANNPDIILADEPTGALDQENGLEVMKILSEIAKTRTVIMVTHDPGLASKYANVIMNISDGKLTSIENNLVNEEKSELVLENNNSKSNMPFWTSFKLALRNLKLKKGRTIATAIGMSIGIIGIALALALTDGTRSSIENQVLSIFPANAITATLNDDEEDSKLSYKDYEKIKDIADDASYVYFQPSSFMFTIASTNKNSADVVKFRENTINGVEDKNPTTMMASVVPFSSGDNSIGFGKVPDKDDKYGVLISLSTAQELIKDKEKVEDLIGKNVYVSAVDMSERSNATTPKNETVKFTIRGITSENTLLSSMYTNEDIYKNVLNDYFDKSIKDTEAMSVMLASDEVASVNSYADELNKKQDKYLFEPSAQSVLSTVNGILDLVRNVLIAFSSVSVFVAILMIAVVIYISVLERRMEIGIIRAIGGRMKDIRNMFVSESMLIGLLSGIIGVVVSYGICEIINSVVTSILRQTNENLPAMNVASLTPQTAIILVLITTLLAIISGLIPSISAAKLDPVDAIRKK